MRASWTRFGRCAAATEGGLRDARRVRLLKTMRFMSLPIWCRTKCAELRLKHRPRSSGIDSPRIEKRRTSAFPAALKNAGLRTSCGRCSRRGFGNGHNAPAGPNACMLGIRLTDGCYRGRALWHPFPRASGASEGGNSRKAAVSDRKAADAARGPDSPYAAGRTAGGADRLLCTAYTAAGGKPCAAASASSVVCGAY